MQFIQLSFQHRHPRHIDVVKSDPLVISCFFFNRKRSETWLLLKARRLCWEIQTSVYNIGRARPLTKCKRTQEQATTSKTNSKTKETVGTAAKHSRHQIRNTQPRQTKTEDRQNCGNKTTLKTRNQPIPNLLLPVLAATIFIFSAKSIILSASSARPKIFHCSK